MRLKLASLAACLLLFCSCSGISLLGTESLLAAPKLNNRQREISEALEATLNMQNIEFVYPQRGEYRSPFVFFDMNGDDLEEAVVFYSYRSDTAENIRARILRQNYPGNWVSVKDIPSDHAEIDLVRFDKILNQDSYCVIFGWKGQGLKSAKLEVCSFDGTTVRPEALQEYQYYLVHDFDRDGIDDIVIAGKESTARRFGLWLLHAKEGKLRQDESVLLARDADGILGIRHGHLRDGSAAVYVDMAVSSGANLIFATEVVQVSGDGLRLVVGDLPDHEGIPAPELVLFESTFRDDDIPSGDFDGDGVVEIPQPVDARGSEEDAEPPGDAGPVLYRFLHLEPEGFVAANVGVINRDDGYTLFFPERWRDAVTVLFDRETDEWRFYAINPDTREPGAELLRIRHDVSRDVVDMFEDYFPLGEKGTGRFSGYIPANLAATPLSVTATEVQGLFFLNFF